MIPETTKKKKKKKFKPKLKKTNQAKNVYTNQAKITHRGGANGDLFLTAAAKWGSQRERCESERERERGGATLRDGGG